MSIKIDIKKISKVLGNKTNLKVIFCLEDGEKSFNLIKKVCKVCPPSLVYSLRTLTKEGIIEKKTISKRPKRSIYRLTKSGIKLLKVIKRIDI